MTRADLPVQAGTPINKELFDSKADGLKESVTVYVSKSGSDSSGNGTSSAPYLTIKKAIDSIPKGAQWFPCSDRHWGWYLRERVSIDSFVRRQNYFPWYREELLTVRGVSIMSSNSVRIAISNITYSSSVSGEGAGLYMSYGSNLQIISTYGKHGHLPITALLEHGSVLNTINVPESITWQRAALCQ